MGPTFHNGQEAVPIRTILQELGHSQQPTTIRFDNSTAEGFANGTIKQKKIKAIDMRFYWIQDCTQQDQFLIYWKPGSTNLGDYFTSNMLVAIGTIASQQSKATQATRGANVWPKRHHLI